uniref:Anaphylatoxin-like domain-containing protein n=1 Tax=Sander lucioperca TaxID=283035 RepID=A0A8C9ZM46_SANLU
LSPLFCRKVMSAPNLLRVGTAENIFVECQDCTGENIQVVINVMNHPTKSTRLAFTSVTLTSARNFQELGQITIPAGSFSKDPTMKQYVYLQAQFPDYLLEKVVLVSFQSGYIFIQTDKTLYTPNSKGEFNTELHNCKGSYTPGQLDRPLDSLESPGLWKVVAKFQSNPQQSYSAEFEVKEYVSIRTTKAPDQASIFYEMSVRMCCSCGFRYLFGQEVDGTAYVVFGVMQDNDKKSFPASLQRVQIEEGIGEVTLKREHITQTYPNISELVGSSIYVAVSVLTESGGEMVEAELRNIQIVTSPYTITFKKTPTFFKPGMSFDVTVEVVNPDGTPAERVTVVIEPGQVDGTTVANGMVKLSVNTEAMEQRLTITARTKDDRISNERQASATMVALPYTTPSNKYIHIGKGHNNIRLGKKRGQLVKNGRYRNTGQVLISLNVLITKNMLPSFRIVAYYHTNGNEVVSDSVWVDVKDSCMGSLRLEPLTSAPSYEPRGLFGLKVTGDPGAVVGLVAVDKGVYVLNNKHRLTQKKVWDTVEKYDTGCTPGGGKDGMGVFYDAGLLFESNMASGTPYRQELKCPAPSRRKRAATIMDVTTSLVSQYEDQLQRDCCLDGMRNTPLSYTCEMRAEYINDGALCAAAFLHCCKEMETQRAERKEDSLILAREEDDSYLDSNEIGSRTNFPESWLWSDVPLDTTSLTRNVPLQDSITTWQFTGISLSRTHGICVGEPLEVIVRKAFFIDLRLPHSAVRGEQLEIKAILHNYTPNPVTVRVDLSEEEHVCSSASKRRRYRQEVKMGAQTTRAVPFIIIPMKEGKYNIEIKAAVRDSSLNDGIIKKLLVVPEGVLVKFPQIIILDPTTNGVGEFTHEMPHYVVIIEQVSALVENAISGNSMGTLIVQPSGCGEQNIAGMTLPVIAATYLDKTNQWETVGFQKRNEALQHIKTGYQNELVFRKNDGSFAVWKDRRSSTWLTAYVAKVFAMANNLVAVQNEHICEAIKFLILRAQQPHGLFREVGTVIHGEMIGDVRGADSDASMTAFCLIAMQESRTQCAASVNSLPGSIDKAVNYLERRLPNLSNPYAVAMTSYALANENKLNKEILYKFVSPGIDNGRVYTLEATAYALLALVKAEAFEEARPVVRWFNTQQMVHGGFGSTQATIMVYQAIAEYWTSAKEPEYDLNVDILLPGRSQPDKFNFNRDNHYATRTTKVRNTQTHKQTHSGSLISSFLMFSVCFFC